MKNPVTNPTMLFLAFLCFPPIQVCSAEKETSGKFFASSNFVGYEDGKFGIMKFSKKQLSKYRKELSKIDDRHIPTGSEGGALFECRVLRSLSKDKYEQPSWQVLAEHVFSGTGLKSGSTFEIKSPTLENGGIELETNHRYRVFALDWANLETGKPGQLFVWEASVLKLKNKKALSPKRKSD